MVGAGGLDDELLALAGGAEAGGDVFEQDEDDGGVGGVRVRTGVKRESGRGGGGGGGGKKRRLESLDDESVSGSEVDVDGVGEEEHENEELGGVGVYPYQGIYKSARDMDELMSMNELEREDILARRRDELNERRQRYELAALVKAQKAAAGATKKVVGRKRVVRGGGGRRGESDLSEQESDAEQGVHDGGEGDSDYAYGGGAASTAKSRKKKLPGQTDAKSAKLSELRNRRKQKAAGVSRGGADSDDDPAHTHAKSRRRYASSSASDVSYSSYSEDQEYPRTTRVKPDTSRSIDAHASDPPSTADLNAAKITRDLIESRLYAPRWREALIGSFFRFAWGTRPRADGRGSETVYRIHQVSDILEKPGNFYDLSEDRSGKWCNVFLVFEHNRQERDAKINMLSRGEFTDSERDRWIAFLNASKQRVPNKPAVVRKADELEKVFTSPLTEADIAKMLDTKKRLRQQAISVMGGSAILGATAGFDSPRATSTPGIATPNSTSTPGAASVAPQSLEARLAAVNERNRALDRSKVSDVERKARSIKIATATAAAAKAQQERQRAEQQKDAVEHEQSGVELTNAKPGTTGMGNGFVAVKNYATLVEVDLGDF